MHINKEAENTCRKSQLNNVALDIFSAMNSSVLRLRPCLQSHLIHTCGRRLRNNYNTKYHRDIVQFATTEIKKSINFIMDCILKDIVVCRNFSNCCMVRTLIWRKQMMSMI
jgi:hypothetical protein